MIVTYLRKNDLNDNSLKKWSILNPKVDERVFGNKYMDESDLEVNRWTKSNFIPFTIVLEYFKLFLTMLKKIFF